MPSKSIIILSIFIITWACIIETTLGAAGRCYQCDSRSPSCELIVDAVAMSGNKTPCNGQCYTRIRDGRMSRGCSWEHGFMTKQPSYSPVFEKDSMWIFCDSSLCNANANVAA